MRYVILRDDDTNALTPIECLEHLYRPFLDRGLPVNLSVIPEVRANLTLPDGRPEGFLVGRRGHANEMCPSHKTRSSRAICKKSPDTTSCNMGVTTIISNSRQKRGRRLPAASIKEHFGCW